MIRASIHTLVSLTLIIFISISALNHLASNSSALDTKEEIEDIYEGISQKLERASNETKTEFINKLLSEEKEYYSSFSELAFSFIKIFKALVLLTCFTLLMQISYFSLIKITKNHDSSAIYHCILGFTAIILYGAFVDREDSTPHIDPEYRYFYLCILLALLIGIFFRSRISSAILILISLYFAYFSLQKHGVIGYQLLLISLSIDAGYSIYKKRLAKQTI